MNPSIEQHLAVFRRDPSDADAFGALRRYYQAQNLLSELGALYERHAAHLREGTAAADLLWRAAEVYQRGEDLEAELRALRKATLFDRGHRRALERLRQLAEQRERWAELVWILQLEIEALMEAGLEVKRQARLEHQLAEIWEHRYGRLDRAIVHYQRAFKADPQQVAAVEAGRRIYAATGQWKIVAQLYQVELATTTDARRRVELLTEIATIHRHKLGDLEGAAKSYAEAVQLRPGDEPLMEDLAEIYASPEWPLPGGLDQAANLLLQVAQRRYARGDRDGAIGYLRRALGADPDNPAAASRLERAYEESNRWEELDRLYRQRLATATTVEAAELQMRRAELLERKLGDRQGAKACYEAILAHEPLGGPASSRLKELYRADGDHAKLLGLLRGSLDALQDRAQKARVMLEMAQLHRDALDEPDRAAELLHEVLQLEPGNRKAHDAYQSYFREKGDHRNLAELLRFAAQWAAEHKAPAVEVCARLEELAEVCERDLGDLPGALEAWQQLAHLHPDQQRSAGAVHRLAARLQAWHAQAVALQREAAGAVSPAHRLQALRRLAQAHWERQVDPLGAIAVLREILQLAPDDEQALALLAALYEREGDLPALAATLKQQLEGLLPRPDRIAALRRLAELSTGPLDRPKDAIWAYGHLLELAPHDQQALDRLQGLLERSDDWPQLVRVLEYRLQMARTELERVESIRALARLTDTRLEDLRRATAYWEDVVTLAPGDAEALAALCRLYAATGEPEALIRSLRSRLALCPELGTAERAALLKQLATVAENQLDARDVAIDAYEQLSRLLPADRGALDALARLYGQQGRLPQLAEIVGRQLDLADDEEEKLALAFRQVDLLEEKLGEPEAAEHVYLRILDTIAPGDEEAHRRLKQLYLRRGDWHKAVEIAERELFLTPVTAENAGDRLRLALEIAALWQDKLADEQAATLAYERVLLVSADHPQALLALRRLYHRVGAPTKLLELATAIYAALPEGRERLVLLIELAQLCEQQLSDPDRAFEWYRRAFDLFPEDQSTLPQLERLAQAHELWEELYAVYTEGRRRAAEPELVLSLSQRMAKVAEERLGDPALAFQAYLQALASDPDVEVLLPELERLAEPAGQQSELAAVYERIQGTGRSRDQRIASLHRLAELAETALGDPHKAQEALVQLYALDPEPEILFDIERLAAQTHHFEPVLALHRQRLEHTAAAGSRLEILKHLAWLHEGRLKDPHHAFLTLLEGLALDLDDPELRPELFRLARLLATAPAPAAPFAPPGPLVIAPSRPERPENTLEVEDEEILELDPSLAESQPEIPVLRTSPPPMPAPPPLPPESEGSFVIATSRPRREDSTVELSGSEVVEVGRVMARLRGADGRAPTSPAPKTEAAASREVAPFDPWLRWAQAYRQLPAPDRAARRRHLWAEAALWEEGPNNADRAFSALTEAALLEVEHPEAEERLVALAQRADRPDRLVEAYHRLLDHAAEAPVLLRLHLHLGTLLAEHGNPAAETHFAAALALDVTNREAAQRLRQLLQQQGQWAKLAAHNERQLEALRPQLTAGERAARLRELADLYEYELDLSFEAAEALSRLTIEDPQDHRSRTRLANLYEKLGLWPRLIEVLETLLARPGDRETQVHTGLRLARTFEVELELPDRAISAYERVLELDPAEPEALEALTRLFAKHDHPQELLAILRKRTVIVEHDEAQLRPLLVQLARALEESGQAAEAATLLQRAREMGPLDADVEEGLARVLVRAGQADGAIRLLRDQVERARLEGRPSTDVAALLVRLARLQAAQLREPAAARVTLEEALAASPGHEEALLELSKLAQREERWPDYVELELELAERTSDLSLAVDRLLRAAAVLQAAGDSSGAVRLFERVLVLDGRNATAVDALLALCGELSDRREQLLLLRRDLSHDASERARLTTELAALVRARGAEPAEVAGLLQQALEHSPDCVPALDALSDLYLSLGRVEAARGVLEGAIRRLEGTATGRTAGPLYYRLGDLFERMGRAEEGYTHLMEALRLQPRNLLLRLAVGQNRFRAHRWREALRHLREALEHPEAAVHGPVAAEALYCAGQCERRLRRPERALPYFEAAVALFEDHVPSLKELANAALEAGQVAKAAALMRRVALATTERAERQRLLRSLATLYLARLEDRRQAAECYVRVLAELHPDDPGRTECLEEMLPTLRDAGEHSAAARVAAALAAALEEIARRVALLLVAASEHDAGGEFAEADARRRAALELDPTCTEAAEGLCRGLQAQGRHAAVVELLTSHLAALPPVRTPEQRRLRAQLYEALGRAHRAQGQTAHAIWALEKAVQLEEDAGLRQELLVLYELHPERAAEALANHRALARDVERIESLRAVARASEDSAPYRAYCIYQVLRAMDQLDEAGERFLTGFVPKDLDVNVPYPGELPEAERRALVALPGLADMREVFVTLWEAGPALLARQLADFGLDPASRVSPVADHDLAKVFSAAARALGIRQTALHIGPDDEKSTRVLAVAPPVLVVTPQVAQAFSVGELRFVLGRALELSQSACVLAAALPRAELAQLLASVLRAFHPRHVKHKAPTLEARVQAEELKRALPYKVARKLGDLFRERPDLAFDTGAYRTALGLTANRVGLVLSGDLSLALRQLAQEEPALAGRPVYPDQLRASFAVRDLLTFAASEEYYLCRAKLGLAD
ncbi:MAG: hypothetical protein IT371_14220 [Deltaproteobacteria bacterium]|nr:hypothetical protein [Deltaproteobacteria bacterium]